METTGCVDQFRDHSVDSFQSFVGVGAKGAALVFGFVERTEVDGNESWLLALKNVERIADASARCFEVLVRRGRKKEKGSEEYCSYVGKAAKMLFYGG